MHKNILVNSIYNLAIKYQTPTNLTYLWSFGIFALVSLMGQLVIGIIVAMDYVAHVLLSFEIVEHIMKDIVDGWLLRYVHANGASVFFIVVYVHIIRGLIYGSYMHPRQILWISGIVLLFIMIIAAFLGYILPWGQMSLWGATVITNLASTIPVIGNDIVIWLWSGFSVANPTLNKFYSLHYLIPLILAMIVASHLFLLHLYGSNNPTGMNYNVDKTAFSPNYTIKDFLSLLPYFAFFMMLAHFIPNYLGHPDNYIEADDNVTPAHIVPEWYFLLFYAILRAIPDKALGVIALISAIVLLGAYPYLQANKRRVSKYKKLFFFGLLSFLFVCGLLLNLGEKVVANPYLELSGICTCLYFSYLFSQFINIKNTSLIHFPKDSKIKASRS